MPFEFVRYESATGSPTHDQPPRGDERAPPAGRTKAVAVWDDFAADPDTWVAILTGARRADLLGRHDLKWTATHGIRACASARGMRLRDAIIMESAHRTAGTAWPLAQRHEDGARACDTIGRTPRRSRLGLPSRAVRRCMSGRMSVQPAADRQDPES